MYVILPTPIPSGLFSGKLHQVSKLPNYLNYPSEKTHDFRQSVDKFLLKSYKACKTQGEKQSV